MIDCLNEDSELVNTATSNDVAACLLKHARLNNRMFAALKRDFIGKLDNFTIPYLEPIEYDVIIRALLLRIMTTELE